MDGILFFSILILIEITSVSEVNAETISETHSLNEDIDVASRILF